MAFLALFGAFAPVCLAVPSHRWWLEGGGELGARLHEDFSAVDSGYIGAIHTRRARLDLGGHCRVVEHGGNHWVEAQQVHGPCVWELSLNTSLGSGKSFSSSLSSPAVAPSWDLCSVAFSMVVDSTGTLEPSDYIIASLTVGGETYDWLDMRDDFPSRSRIASAPFTVPKRSTVRVQVHLMARGAREAESVRFTDFTVHGMRCAPEEPPWPIARLVIASVASVGVAWIVHSRSTRRGQTRQRAIRSVASNPGPLERPGNVARMPARMHALDEKRDLKSADLRRVERPRSEPTPVGAAVGDSVPPAPPRLRKSHTAGPSHGRSPSMPSSPPRLSKSRTTGARASLLLSRSQARSHSESDLLDVKSRRISDAGPASWDLDVKDIKFEREIGQGHFGKAWVARWHGEKIVVKVVEVKSWSFDVVDAFKKEAKILARLAQHPRIVRFCGAATKPTQLMLAMQYMPEGSVHARFVAPGRSGQSSRKTIRNLVGILHDASVALSYLHSQTPPVMHCDLAARNILLDSRLRAYLADFGMARVVQRHGISTGPDVTLSVPWSAPENFKGHFTTATDVYMFACTMYEVVYCQAPWGGVLSAMVPSKVQRGQRPQRDPDMEAGWPPDVLELIGEGWDAKAGNRPTSKDIQRRLCLALEVLDSESKARLPTKPGLPQLDETASRGTQGHYRRFSPTEFMRGIGGAGDTGQQLAVDDGVDASICEHF